MKKSILFFLLFITLLIGYAIGNRTDIFSNSHSAPPYMYNVELPEEVTGKGSAFSDIVKVISPVVVNISTSKTIVDRDSAPFSQLFDRSLKDFFDPYDAPHAHRETSLGSGVLVSPDGYIITNSHVVEKSDEIKVTLYDKKDYKGKIIGTDPTTDLAVIKISAKNLPAIKLGDSDKLEVGAFVLAFGNPYSLGHTVTMGIVSATGRANVGIADYEYFIQTDAAINPGNSGGPLVNIKGELVGINTAIFSRTGGNQGIGFAVPSNMAKIVMTQLIEDGKVTRGWLGVAIQNLTPDLAKEFGLKRITGALVTEIFKGSPADKADVKRGDVVLEINGKEMKNVETLRTLIAQSMVGSDINLKISRDRKILSLNVTVAEYPQDLAKAVPDQSEEHIFTEDNTIAGFTVMELSREVARQLGLSGKETGVVITRVNRYSAAEEAGLKKGDLIQEINKRRINTLKDFNSLLPELREGDTLLLFVNRSGNKYYITLKLYS
jgi:serine protease Do